MFGYFNVVYVWYFQVEQYYIGYFFVQCGKKFCIIIGFNNDFNFFIFF